MTVPNRSGRALVIYHKDCTDGACAAWAAAHHLGRAGLPEPVLLAAHPGITPEGAFAEEWAIVFVVDVCIPRADVERLGAWVLDHHKTNEPLLAGYARARFDMSRSGAGLAWDEVQAILWGLGYGVTQAARISDGMRAEMDAARAAGIVVEERRLPALALDPSRCDRCDWPLAASWLEGCIAGGCSRRPVPKRRCPRCQVRGCETCAAVSP